MATMLMAGLSMVGAASQANAQREQGEYQRMQANENARMMELQAEDAVKRGDQAASGVRKNAIKTRADQRAAMAANGINMDEGSALSLQEETQAMGEEDVRTVKNNAWREAWGLRTQAQNTRASGGMAESAGKNAASMTLLTGAVRAGGDILGKKKD